jgi:hypothetical protein
MQLEDRLVFRRNIASIFRVEEYVKHETWETDGNLSENQVEISA